MTTEERAAYVAGIQVMTDLAENVAKALGPKIELRPLRYEMAAEALRAVAAEGKAIIEVATARR